jgi:hypothetical protein
MTITDVGPTVFVDRDRDRRHRAFVRDLRRAAPMPSYRGLPYSKQMLFESQREVVGVQQEDGIDLAMEYDTPGARRARERLRREKLRQQGFQHAARESTDPLNIMGPARTRKEVKAREEAERLASGRRKHLVPDPDNPKFDILVETVGSSHHNLAENRKRNAPKDPDETLRMSAADRFKLTFDLATLGKASNAANMERVDTSGGQSSAAEIALEAQAQLKKIRWAIGDRQFDIIEARIGIGGSSEDIRKNGGQDHQSNNYDLKVALNALAKHFDGVVIVDRTWEAARQIIKKAGMGFLR